MAEDTDMRPDDRIPVNDNSNPDGGDIASSSEKLDRVVLSIARLIGRRMAREEFERMRAITANDNVSRSAGDSEADEGTDKER